jgi:hypothetical protein
VKMFPLTESHLFRTPEPLVRCRILWPGCQYETIAGISLYY